MEKLIVQNFGALLNIDIEIKDINIYVGLNSSGKGTAAKLVSIFKGGSLSTTSSPFELFKKALANNNIDFNIHNDTLIRYENKDLYYEIKGLNFSTNIQNNQLMRPLNPRLPHPIFALN